MDRRSFVAGGAPLLMAGLAGCAVSAPELRRVASIRPDQGGVVFRMIVNASGSHPASRLSFLTLQGENLPNTPYDPYELFGRMAGGSGTVVYSGLVPAGRYRIWRASNRAVGGSTFPGDMTYSFPLQQLPASFEVQPGAVVMLGTLILQPGADRRFSFQYVAAGEETRASVRMLFPQLVESQPGQVFRTVDLATSVPADAPQAQAFRRRSLVVGGLWQSNQGDLCIGGKMGTARWRKAGEERWRVLDLGSWSEVRCLRRYLKGLVAGGEDGLLKYSADEGRTWRALTPPAPGLISTLLMLPSGRTVAFCQVDSEWQAFVSPDLLAGTWQRVAALRLNNNRIPSVFVRGKQMVFVEPSGATHLLDAETLQVEQRETSSGELLAVSPGGDAMVRLRTGWTLSHEISSDLGQTWRDLRLPGNSAVVALKDANALYAYLQPEMTGSLFAKPARFVASRDGGASWTAGSWPAGLLDLAQLAVDPVGGAVLAFAGDGRLWRSRDDGNSWSAGWEQT